MRYTDAEKSLQANEGLSRDSAAGDHYLGEAVVERYEVLEADAGTGGFGRIHRARDLTLERDVAIKDLAPVFKLEPSPADIERFRREAKTLASLSHPNIPAIYDVQFNDTTGTFRIIFQWVNGYTLAQYLRDRGVLTLEQARRWFANICSALEHAHSRKIVHRDVKPSNIMIAPEADVCILVDFGISFSATELTRLTSSPGLGTPGYMSPEQERGEEVTVAADIYGLGIVLYESLAGTRPSVGGYRPLSAVNDSIPPSIDVLIQECLREEPTARVTSATEFMNRLNKALEPHTTFSATLTSGSLYEIQVAIGAMTAASYSRLPLGQRLAILSRLKDLVRVNEARLANAVAALLAELVRVGHSSRMADYALIVQHAFEYGLERKYGETWVGNVGIRDSLNAVASTAEDEAHQMISEALFSYLDTHPLGVKPGWYLHQLRELLQHLLANPNCEASNAERLAGILDELNQLSHKADF